jgi:diguanylate cyclase (GGDEF)-like protein
MTENALLSSPLGLFALFLICCFFGLMGFFVYTKMKKPARAAQGPPADENPDSLENPAGMTLDEIKANLEIKGRDQKPVLFRFLRATNILELNVYLEIINQSSETVTIQQIDWECWMTGFHIKTGLFKNPIRLNACTFKPEIRLQEILSDSQLKEILWMKKNSKGYVSGLVFCQTALGKFQKKFSLLNLDFSITEEAEEQAKQFLEESGVDDLTGALSRRYLEHSFQELIDKASHQSPLSFLMIDADNFKEINDTQGHLVGDDILKKICEEIKAVIGTFGLLVRFGGDEFCVILQDCDADKARTTAEQIRQNIEKCDVEAKGKKLPFTVSIGVATVTEKVFYKTVVKSADEVLGVSKRNGKNRITVNTRKIRDY